MKIFIVSEAGKIADVTLHTSCKSADESALKVTMKTLMRKIIVNQTHSLASRWRWWAECPTSKFYRVMLSCNNSSGLFFLHLRLHWRLRNTRGTECRSQNQIRNFFGPGRVLACQLHCRAGKYFTKADSSIHITATAMSKMCSLFVILISDELKCHKIASCSFPGILYHLDARESAHPPSSRLQALPNQILAGCRLYRKVRT